MTSRQHAMGSRKLITVRASTAEAIAPAAVGQLRFVATRAVRITSLDLRTLRKIVGCFIVTPRASSSSSTKRAGRVRRRLVRGEGENWDDVFAALGRLPRDTVIELAVRNTSQQARRIELVITTIETARGGDEATRGGFFWRRRGSSSALVSKRVERQPRADGRAAGHRLRVGARRTARARRARRPAVFPTRCVPKKTAADPPRREPLRPPGQRRSRFNSFLGSGTSSRRRRTSSTPRGPPLARDHHVAINPCRRKLHEEGFD